MSEGETILITGFFIKDEGPNAGQPYLLRIDFSDGRALWVEPMIYGARLMIGRQDESLSVDDVFYYHSSLLAILAAMTWALTINTDKEPANWYRNPITGRRRTDGDPSQEYLLN